MIENETKRPSIIEFQTRISHQCRHSKAERENSSAFVTLQIQKDTAVVSNTAEKILSHINGI